MSGKLEKRVAYNYNIQSAYIMSAKGELYNLVELLGNAGVIVTTSGLINIARCGDSRIGEKIENAPNFEGDVEEVVEAREFLGEVYENLKERLDTLHKELYAKIKKIEYVYIQHEGNPIELEHVKGNSDGRILRIDGNTIKENNTLKSVGQNGNVVVYCVNNNKENISVENLDGLNDEQLSLYGIRKINIPLSEELRGLPNGVHDSIEVRDSGLFLIKRVESVPYTTGDENLSNCITNGTITYKAKSTPTEKYLDNQIPIEDYVENLNLNTYEGTTYIQSENSIKPVFYFKANTDKYAVNLEGEDIKIENSRVGKVEDLVIKGNTYQNLFNYPTEVLWGTYDSVSQEFVNTSDEWFQVAKTDMLKLNTTYTLIFLYKSTVDKIGVRAEYSEVGYNPTICEDFGDISANNSFQLFKQTITTKTYVGNLRILIRRCYGGTVTIKYPVLLEGDWTNKEVPEYINGIEGVGNKSKNLFNGDLARGWYDANGNTYYDTQTVMSNNVIPVKPNTGYTISCSTPEEIWVHFFKDRNTISAVNKESGSGKDSYKTSFTFTTPSDCNFIGFNTVTDKYVSLDTKFQVEEGSVATEYEPYCEGKIEILSKNKNLFNMENLVSRGGATILNRTATSITITTLNGWTGVQVAGYRLKPNTTYRLKFDATHEKVKAYIRFGDTDGKYTTEAQAGGSNNFTFTIPENISYVLISIETSIPLENVNISNIQLEEGVEETVYEPYKKNKTQILLDEPLMKLPDGTCDTIEQREDGVYLIQRVGKIVLNGSEHWGYNNYTPNQNNTLCFNSNAIPFGNEVISDKFNFLNISEFDTSDFECITSGESEYYALMIRINKNVLNQQNVNGFKEWLQANPVTVYYELTTPVITELNIDLDIDTYQDVTYISCDTNIKPTLSLKANGNIEEEFNGEDITIVKAKNGRVRDIIIKGKTIVDTTQNKMISVGEAEGNKISILSIEKASFEKASLIPKEYFLKGQTSPATIQIGNYKGRVGTVFEDSLNLNNVKVVVKLNKILDADTPLGVFCDTQSIIMDKGQEKSFIAEKLTSLGFYKWASFTDGNGKDRILEYLTTGALEITVLPTQNNNNYRLYPNFNAKLDKKDFLLPIEGGLKSLPNGVCDTIEQREDGIYLMQRVEKVEYTSGDENLNDCITDGTITYKAKEITAEYKLGLYPRSLNPITMFEGKNIITTNDVKAPLVIEVEQPRNPAIADIINGQDEVRNLQDLNRAYMSNLREDMQNINHEADATNLDLDMRLLMLEMERM